MKETPFFRTDAESPEAILFGLSARGNQTATETLSELQQLARAGQFRVAGCVVQQRRTPDPRSYVGRGKLEELVELVEQTKAQAVICDDSLSPAQGRLIEQTLKVPVLDRSELILQIFASHARSRQAKL
ncbi:MAG: GTPase HflX, partial [Planctomycetota bacterium]|nr:GTPase HflX [Planctomycetota bacterium]